jgi:hypothetical protein
MRTKTLILTAALSVAGIATSMAQVFSVNAVGYVNKKVPGGNKLALIANPLDAGAGNNTIANLFKGVPDGTQIYKFTPTGYKSATYDSLENAFVGDGVNEEVKPGEGVFVRNTSANEITITFVGEVPQGDLKNPLPAGLSIRASMVPQAGTPPELGLPANDGDQVYLWSSAAQSYTTFTFDGLENIWVPAFEPANPNHRLEVGDAFFLRRGAAGSWDRTFSVNQ